MRIRWIVVLVLVLVSLGAGVRPAVAGATAVGAAHSSSVQKVKATFVLGTVERTGNDQIDKGTYRSAGQLGSGHYLFSSVFDASACQGIHDYEHQMPLSGTATIIRSDGAHMDGTIRGHESCLNDAPTLLQYDVAVANGTRDLVSARLSFGGSADIPEAATEGEAFAFDGTISVRQRVGYWMMTNAGDVYSFGGAGWYGNADSFGATFSAVHLEPTPDGGGYWIVDSFGRVLAFGDARWLGNANPAALDAGERVTTISATPAGRGYWLFTNRGRVLTFGDAVNYGDLRSLAMNGPVIASVATPSGHGYYMVAGDGGVFAFGDARFRGSMGAVHLNQPVVGVAPTADGDGYWLVASDGGVFAFNAPFLGSMGKVGLNQPMAGLLRFGTGYLMVANDGGIFDFSDEPFFGSLGADPPPSPVISVGAVS